MIVYTNNQHEVQDDLDKIILTLVLMIQDRFSGYGWEISIDFKDSSFVMNVDAARWCVTTIAGDMLIFVMNYCSTDEPPAVAPYFSVPLCDPDAVEKWWGVVESKLDIWIRSGSW